MRIRKTIIQNTSYPDLLSVYNVSSENAGELRFLDIISMIDNVALNRYLGSDLIKDKETWFAYECRNLVNLLVTTVNTVIPVRLFMSIPIKDFYQYLIDNAESKEAAEAVNREARYVLHDIDKVYMYIGKEFSYKCTIGNVIDTIQCAGREYWLPEVRPLKEYTDHVYRVRRCRMAVIMRGFNLAWKSDMLLDKLNKRLVTYGKNEEQNNIENNKKRESEMKTNV